MNSYHFINVHYLLCISILNSYLNYFSNFFSIGVCICNKISASYHANNSANTRSRYDGKQSTQEDLVFPHFVHIFICFFFMINWFTMVAFSSYGRIHIATNFFSDTIAHDVVLVSSELLQTMISTAHFLR